MTDTPFLDKAEEIIQLVLKSKNTIGEYLYLRQEIIRILREVAKKGLEEK